MAKVDEIARGFVLLRFDCAGLQSPAAPQAPVPVTGFPTEYPHRIFRNHIRNLAAVKVMNICQEWFQKTNPRGSVCPQLIFLPLMAVGMEFQEDLLRPPPPPDFSWQRGVAVLFIPGANPLQSEFVLSKLIFGK